VVSQSLIGKAAVWGIGATGSPWNVAPRFGHIFFDNATYMTLKRPTTLEFAGDVPLFTRQHSTPPYGESTYVLVNLQDNLTLNPTFLPWGIATLPKVIPGWDPSQMVQGAYPPGVVQFTYLGSESNATDNYVIGILNLAYS
jgi:hypothetical protein